MKKSKTIKKGDNPYVQVLLENLTQNADLKLKLRAIQKCNKLRLRLRKKLLPTTIKNNHYGI